MAVDPSRVAHDLFEGVLAPLVLGGPIVPGHAIGARTALALTEELGKGAVDDDLLARVQLARVRRARRLVPIDRLRPPSSDEWALGAALHDVLQATNPGFDGALRRSSARRLLELAATTIERVPPPAHVGEALSRHTWFARAGEIHRTDTRVSWWTGSDLFLGVDVPARLTAWPELRRVSVDRSRRPLLELSPLAVERDRLVEVVAAWLARSPLTALATCTRGAPRFEWDPGTLALVASPLGRTLALRTVARLDVARVDAALGDATRRLVEHEKDAAAPAHALLAERDLDVARSRARPAGAAGEGHA